MECGAYSSGVSRKQKEYYPLRTLRLERVLKTGRVGGEKYKIKGHQSSIQKSFPDAGFQHLIPRKSGIVSIKGVNGRFWVLVVLDAIFQPKMAAKLVQIGQIVNHFVWPMTTHSTMKTRRGFSNRIMMSSNNVTQKVINSVGFAQLGKVTLAATSCLKMAST